MNYQRIDNWASELNACIDEHRNKPFAWGKNDCATFAVKCETAICGSTRFPELLEANYTNKFGYLRECLRRGYYGMFEGIHERCDEIDKSVAGRGDWGCVNTPEGWAVGVLTGEKIAVTGAEGLLFLDYGAIIKTWRI